MDSLNKEINFARAFYFLSFNSLNISQFKSTKSLEKLIFEYGNILRNNEN
ncbi:hypothetical protein [Arcobacter sp. AHV-9/2010]|nr:hypothetical protein [Arcobacter sp. CECT 9299]